MSYQAYRSALFVLLFSFMSFWHLLHLTLLRSSLLLCSHFISFRAFLFDISSSISLLHRVNLLIITKLLRSTEKANIPLIIRHSRQIYLSLPDLYPETGFVPALDLWDAIFAHAENRSGFRVPNCSHRLSREQTFLLDEA